jgi:parvulin-like peptidyl-prolyl isomerase
MVMKNGLHIASSIALLSMIGCAGGPKELAPDRFYRAQPAGTDEPKHILEDRPNVIYNDVHMDLMDKSPQDPLHLKEPAAAPQPDVTAVSAPSDELAKMQTTQPIGIQAATQPVAHTTVKPSAGGYMTVGAVVVEINGQPIYADKVLQSLNAEFASEAKQRDEQSFRVFAENEIKNQVYRFVNDELIYAQAENVLDQQEKDLANQLTMMWRQRMVTENDGSLQEARAKFAADGIDFDEALKEKYRQNMTAIYIEKKIRPKVQVTAHEMREYYDKHLTTEFSEPDTVQYRLITINVAKSGSREEALKRIQDIAARAQKGEDFQSLASQYNDDDRLARNGGLESPMQKGALKSEQLNKAVFSTPQGQLTGIIDGGDNFYIAKIENIKPGRTQPFDDPKVQESVKNTLQKEQMEPLLQRERDKRLANGVMVPNPPLFDPVVEMAMQKYPQWAAK